MVEGPGWRREQDGFGGLPLVVRPGSVVPFGTVGDRPDYDYSAAVTVYVSGCSQDVDVTVPALYGSPAATLSVTRGNDVLTAETRRRCRARVGRPAQGRA